MQAGERTSGHAVWKAFRRSSSARTWCRSAIDSSDRVANLLGGEPRTPSSSPSVNMYLEDQTSASMPFRQASRYQVSR